ncbi:MAG TPA: hypothetical protein VM261_07885, partial [Kofleriaceae bacterium]|nr:hypothetical protein [Kofleriaceae bacterium]
MSAQEGLLLVGIIRTDIGHAIVEAGIHRRLQPCRHQPPRLRIQLAAEPPHPRRTIEPRPHPDLALLRRQPVDTIGGVEVAHPPLDHDTQLVGREAGCLDGDLRAALLGEPLPSVGREPRQRLGDDVDVLRGHTTG